MPFLNATFFIDRLSGLVGSHIRALAVRTAPALSRARAVTLGCTASHAGHSFFSNLISTGAPGLAISAFSAASDLSCGISPAAGCAGGAMASASGWAGGALCNAGPLFDGAAGGVEGAAGAAVGAGFW